MKSFTQGAYAGCARYTLPASIKGLTAAARAIFLPDGFTGRMRGDLIRQNLDYGRAVGLVSIVPVQFAGICRIALTVVGKSIRRPVPDGPESRQGPRDPRPDLPRN